MRYFKKIAFIFLSNLFIFYCSFSSFAISSYDQMSFDTFEDGPFAGQRASFRAVSDSGNTGIYGIPNFRDGSDKGEGYYRMAFSSSSYDYLDGYIYSDTGEINNIVIASEAPLLELYLIDSIGSIVRDVLEDAYITAHDGQYFYGVSLYGGVGVSFRSGSTFIFTELSTAFNGGSYYDAVVNNMPYLGGVYNGNSTAVRYPGLVYNGTTPYSLSYGLNYWRFPVVCFDIGDANDVYYMNFADSDGLLHEGSNYNFVFSQSNMIHGWVYFLENYNAVWSGNDLVYSFNGADASLSGPMFYFQQYFEGPVCIIYRSSSSDDVGVVPPENDDNGASGSPDYSAVLGQIGSQLKNVLSAVSEGSQSVVNNITYQTTQITNTITNTVTNMTQQITQGLSDVKQGITDKLQGVQEGISSSIEEANKEQMENDQKLHDEQIAADKENTDQITGGYDNSGMSSDKTELDGVLDQYEQAEEELFDDAQGHINDFEFNTPLDSFTGPLADVSYFLNGMFEAMGPMNVVISFSLTLTIAMVMIGWYRFKGGR